MGWRWVGYTSPRVNLPILLMAAIAPGYAGYGTLNPTEARAPVLDWKGLLAANASGA
jgi:hypothetical protein